MNDITIPAPEFDADKKEISESLKMIIPPLITNMDEFEKVRIDAIEAILKLKNFQFKFS